MPGLKAQVPGGHGWQRAMSAEVAAAPPLAEPRAHVDAPTNVHEVEPGEDEKEPPGHAVQVAAAGCVEPCGPKKPAAQMTPVHEVRPGAVEYVPGGQTVQELAAVWFARPYEPAAQMTPAQTVAPAALEKVPEGQAAHVGVVAALLPAQPCGAHALDAYEPAAQGTPMQLVEPAARL